MFNAHWETARSWYHVAVMRQLLWATSFEPIVQCSVGPLSKLASKAALAHRVSPFSSSASVAPAASALEFG